MYKGSAIAFERLTRGPRHRPFTNRHRRRDRFGDQHQHVTPRANTFLDGFVLARSAPPVDLVGGSSRLTAPLPIRARRQDLYSAAFTAAPPGRLRGGFFKVLNHSNFGSPTSTLTSPLFGRSTETLANSLGSGGPNGGFNPVVPSHSVC